MWIRWSLALALFGMGSAMSADADPANDVRIIDAPVPNYPVFASWFGMQSLCEVRFSLYDYGRVVVVDSAQCSSVLFCDSAIESVRNATLQVIDVVGTETPGERTNLLYPLEYAFYDGPGPTGEMVDCEMPDPLA